MGLETERKFLVKQELWNAVKKDGALYHQGYLLRSKGKNIRVRLIENDKGYITIKGKTKGISRQEFEYTIPEQDARKLLDNFCDSIISKKRYEINVHDKLWEVDEFMDDNAGLILGEIELKNEDEGFTLPDWAGREVTSDKRYYNSELSVNPYKNWKP